MTNAARFIAAPSAPAHVASTTAATLGSSGDAPAMHATAKQTRKRLVKCAACAARGPGTAQDRRNPAANSAALYEYSAADKAARRITPGSDSSRAAAIAGAPATPNCGRPSMAHRRNEYNDRDAAADAKADAAAAGTDAADASLASPVRFSIFSIFSIVVVDGALTASAAERSAEAAETEGAIRSFSSAPHSSRWRVRTAFFCISASPPSAPQNRTVARASANAGHSVAARSRAHSRYHVEVPARQRDKRETFFSIVAFDSDSSVDSRQRIRDASIPVARDAASSAFSNSTRPFVPSHVSTITNTSFGLASWRASRRTCSASDAESTDTSKFCVVWFDVVASAPAQSDQSPSDGNDHADADVVSGFFFLLTKRA